ncbi:MAG TPA: patatin-like phospholipase family protein [Bacteroidia bacterium]|nr:patatin-like phospholipase family protein [Bacteroidia bacterium]
MSHSPVKESVTAKLFLTRFIFSFPIQLFVILIKKNHILMIYWFLLFGFVTGNFAARFGIPYLFLDPEYLGTVGWWSFFIIGLMCGAFIMVFNISSYIINAYTFPFIASLARPFLKYAINNFIVPALFILVYFYELYQFQRHSEFQTVSTILMQYVAFLCGLLLTLFVTLTYFFRTNKDIVRSYGMKASDADPDVPLAEHLSRGTGIRRMLRLSNRLKWRVDTYLSTPLKVKLVRRTEHYDTKMFDAIIRQNHLNAAIVEIFVFGIFILLGLFREYKPFLIPAGASIILIFSMFIMLTSAFRFWLKEWATTMFIFLFIALNFFSKFDFEARQNKVYGMNYHEPKAVYNPDTIKISRHDIEQDSLHAISILEKWKSNLHAGANPKLILINASGGGLRSAMWTFRMLQAIDSTSGGKVFSDARLITGASGGMIGAAYFRELFLLKQEGKINSVSDTKFLEDISDDLLNPVGVSLVVNDIFFNFQKFSIGKQRYNKDRAYAFEKHLNENTNHILEKSISDYTDAESDARIPQMIFTPAIVNDGRRLLISSQPVAYLAARMEKENFRFTQINDCMEFGKVFSWYDAGQTRFTSVLRMSATFPYILPAVTLPTTPPAQVMDAGIRDNFGLKTTFRYLFTLRTWIEENTSGVIVINIRDTRKDRKRGSDSRGSILENLFSPVGNIYRNLVYLQEYETDEEAEYAKAWFNPPLAVISFELPSTEEEISLSWHLTSKEKNFIRNATELSANKNSFEYLKKLLNY